MRKLAALFILFASVGAVAQNAAISSTVTNANAIPKGMNLGTFDYFRATYMKNILGLTGNPGFQGFVSKQVFQVQGGYGLYTTTQVQANLNNLNFDPATLNYYATSNATFNVGYSTGAEAGCNGTVTASTQAASQFSASVSSITGTTTLTLTYGSVTGTAPTVGSTIGVNISNAVGTTGHVMTAVITSSTIMTISNPGGGSVTGTVVSSGNGVMYTFPACAAALKPGDIFTLAINIPSQYYTPGSGWTVSTSGTATAGVETSDTCTTSQTVDPVTGASGTGCGGQSFQCLGGASGGTCTIQYTADNTSSIENFILLNGAYKTNFMAKNAAGSGTISFNVARTVGPTNFTYPLVTPTGTWASYGSSNTFSETTTTSNLGAIFATFTITVPASGSTYLDNVFWGSTGGVSANTSNFTDTLYNTLLALHPGTLRDWQGVFGQNSLGTSDAVAPMFTQSPSSAGVGSAYNGGNVVYGLGEFLKLCQLTGTVPHFTIPGTSSTADMQNLSDYLFGGSGTTFGAIRIAQGGPSASGGWASVFPVIIGSMGNENWNSGELGQGVGFRGDASYFYEDYANWSATRFAAMRAQPSFNSAMHLVVGAQTASAPADAVTLAHTALADGVEIGGYYAYSIATTSPTSAFYQPTLTEPYSNIVDTSSSSNFQQIEAGIRASSGCGASGTAACEALVYEDGVATQNAGCNQACLDAFVDAAFTAETTADQYMENQSVGINYQSVFQISQYYFGDNGFLPHMWGNVTDIGGQQSLLNTAKFGGSANWRPNFIGAEIANNCTIGPRITVSTTSVPTYNLAANSNGVNAINNVPAYDIAAYQSGSTVCILISSRQVSSSGTLTFTGGSIVPSGTVTQVQATSAAISSINEATGNNATNTVAATVYPTTSTLTSFNASTGITVLPYEVRSLTFTTGGTPTAATPTFSPVAGTYSGTQNVTVSCSTGPTACFSLTTTPATNGTTGCTTGTLVTGTVSIASTSTLHAICGGTGYLDGTPATAAYTITGVLAPILSNGTVAISGNTTIN
jgi:hypothetical protein